MSAASAAGLSWVNINSGRTNKKHSEPLLQDRKNLQTLPNSDFAVWYAPERNINSNFCLSEDKTFHFNCCWDFHNNLWGATEPDKFQFEATQT